MSKNFPNPISFFCRSATLQDLPRLVEIEESSFQTDRLARANFRWFLRQGKCLLDVITLGEVVAGYGLVTFKKNSRRGRLYSIAIAPELTGQRLGDHLLTHLETRAHQTGLTAIYLEVNQHNPYAIKLYERRGYRIVGERLGYYEDGSPAYCMEKELH